MKDKKNVKSSIKNTLNINAGEKFRQRREALHLSREGLAKKVGLTSDKPIKDLEIGKHYPRMETLLSLCDAMEIDMDYLFKEGEPKNKRCYNASQYTGLSEDAVSFIRTLSDNDKDRLNELFSEGSNISELLYNLTRYKYSQNAIQRENEKHGGGAPMGGISPSQNNDSEIAMYYISNALTEIIYQQYGKPLTLNANAFSARLADRIKNSTGEFVQVHPKKGNK